MNGTFSIQIKSSASVSDVLPDQFKNDWLPGSAVTSAKGDFGEISTQKVSINGIEMYYTIAELSNEVRLQLSNLTSFFFIQVQLSGSFEIISELLSFKFSRQDHYSILFLADSVIDLKVMSGAAYKSLVIAFPVAYILSVLGYYPLLDELEKSLRIKKNIVSLDNSLSAGLAEKIYSLLHTPFVPLTEEFYQGMLSEIAHTVLNEYCINEKISSPFNMHDIACVHVAKEYIDTHLLEHLTIVQLSRMAGINQLKLKKGFKAIYGIGVYGYQLQQRLLIAETALEKTTKLIHQIARQAGYKKVSNFSAAFKKVYGISPFQYRKKLQQR